MDDRKSMVDYLSTSEESDARCSQTIHEGDTYGYESPDLFDSPSSPVLASESESEDFPSSKRRRCGTASASRTTPMLKPNYHKQGRVLPPRPQLAERESSYSHASASGRRRSANSHVRGPNTSSEGSSGDAYITRSEAAEMKKLLRAVVTRLDKIEAKLEASNLSLSSPDSVSRSKAVPRVVKAETRKTYKMLVDTLEFDEFDTSPGITFKHPKNVATSNKLINEVKLQNPMFSSADIRAAVYTYYKTLNQEASLKRTGTYKQGRTQRRHRERIVRRLAERVSEFKQLSFSEVDHEKWRKIFISEMISSDESETETGKGILSIKKLPWRSEKVDRFFTKLDEAHQARKSEQATRQTKPRLHLGAVSARPPPTSDQLPAWAIASQK